MKSIPKLMKLFVEHFGENAEVKWKDLCPLWEKHKDSVEHICHMQKNPKYKAKHGFYKVFTDNSVPMSEAEQVAKLVELAKKKRATLPPKISKPKKEDFDWSQSSPEFDLETDFDSFDDVDEILRVHSNS